ncbi:tubby-like F-box protein 5 [Iris pallida]|uniref:Tubby-like F-box protein 5 n=1 Tax=Iris pallida TaxID=29817 RepID=A0AAX6G0T2_IRIPA|nr:tubby-like F-box protein 5 [Iris pallida]
MSFKSIVRELKEMRDGIGSRSRKGGGADPSLQSQQQLVMLQRLQRRRQGRWAELPSELLRDVIERVEAAEEAWPARRDVVACASVCRSWRETTKEIVRTPEESARITFPISQAAGTEGQPDPVLYQAGADDWDLPAVLGTQPCAARRKWKAFACSTQDKTCHKHRLHDIFGS